MTVTGPPRGSTGDTRDEVAAQRFRRRRLRSALLTGDPDTPVNPMGRLIAGVYGGVLVTVLLLAVAGIYGVLRPGGSTAWQEPGALVVDEDAGQAPGGLPQGGETVLDFPNSHLQYALTWFGLALALVGVFGVWAWRQVRGT